MLYTYCTDGTECLSRTLRIGQPGANYATFTAKPNSCHVHSTLWVTPPSSPCSTLSVDAEPARQHAEIIFYAQCADIIEGVL